jgi:hypothetical protein
MNARTCVVRIFGSDETAFLEGAKYINDHNLWGTTYESGGGPGLTIAGNYTTAAKTFTSYGNSLPNNNNRLVEYGFYYHDATGKPMIIDGVSGEQKAVDFSETGSKQKSHMRHIRDLLICLIWLF